MTFEKCLWYWIWTTHGGRALEWFCLFGLGYFWLVGWGFFAENSSEAFGGCKGEILKNHHLTFVLYTRHCCWAYIFFLRGCLSQSAWWWKASENTICPVSIGV